jgi:hypothetical protein
VVLHPVVDLNGLVDLAEERLGANELGATV